MLDTQAKTLPLYRNGRHIGTIPLHAALAAAENDDVILTRKGRGRKARITAVHLIATLTSNRPCCSITASETENFAFVHNGVRLAAKDRMGTFDSVVEKVTAWPSVHDDKAPTISAGRAYGVFCPFPPIEERVVTYA